MLHLASMPLTHAMHISFLLLACMIRMVCLAFREHKSSFIKCFYFGFLYRQEVFVGTCMPWDSVLASPFGTSKGSFRGMWFHTELVSVATVFLLGSVKVTGAYSLRLIGNKNTP